MYNYMKGKVTIVKGSYIVLENNDIGYQIKTANPFKFEIGTIIMLWTYLHIREDIMDIYGFGTSEERDLFLQLISVKGLGPKGALAIIASDSIEKVINAIKNSDTKYLQRFPGIGVKASQQIVLDLHGKINFGEEKVNEDPKVAYINEALKAMGYRQNEIKSIAAVIESNIEQPTAALIKTVLKSLSK
ncbi:MAG: Holliday junction branch migration protein RuvA [Bacilli bacterium]|nr:Holliday junction branch migration protein RuvA [Bacilli bacterium]MDD4056472.1 Holliday junction branch migration protein RuvA [Bacilli bacterium]